MERIILVEASVDYTYQITTPMMGIALLAVCHLKKSIVPKR